MRHRPSRFMPRYIPQPMRWFGWIFLVASSCGLLYLLFAHPIATVVVVASFAVLTIVENRRHRRRMSELMASRRGETICDFAKSFDLHSVDPWVVRAVYEQVQAHLGASVQLPIRASDVLKKDLRLDDDDLDMDLAVQISERTGRSLAHTEHNPWYGRVQSVSDLVMFFNAQCKATAI